MIEGFWLWLAFGLLAATTLITRGSFIMAGEKGRLPPGINPFNPKLLAGIVVSLIALRTRRPWLPFLLGMGLLVGLQKGLGW
jgi:branched-subunit amino acid transport protein